MTIINWLIEIGTNDAIYSFVDNNSLILLGVWGLFIGYLRYRAKQTPSPDDDAFIEELNNKVKTSLFSRVK